MLLEEIYVVVVGDPKNMQKDRNMLYFQHVQKLIWIHRGHEICATFAC